MGTILPPDFGLLLAPRKIMGLASFLVMTYSTYTAAELRAIIAELEARMPCSPVDLAKKLSDLRFYRAQLLDVSEREARASQELEVGRRDRQAWLKERRIQEKLAKSLRRNVLKLCFSGSRTVAARRLVGCSMRTLREHIEKQFLPGMTWDNHGLFGWHIDHKRPLASFDLTDPKQVAKASHFTNLQPLWAADNLSKGSRI